MFFIIIHKNLMVLYKVRHVYSPIHKFWSYFYQLVKIFVIINPLFSYATLSLHQPGKVFPLFFTRLNTFAAVDIQPLKSTLFFSVTFSTSLVDLEKNFN